MKSDVLVAKLMRKFFKLALTKSAMWGFESDQAMSAHGEFETAWVAALDCIDEGRWMDARDNLQEAADYEQWFARGLGPTTEALKELNGFVLFNERFAEVR